VSYLRTESNITRRVVTGPTVHIPASNEWVHEFKWSATSALHGVGRWDRLGGTVIKK
jgi:hypothetical protein